MSRANGCDIHNNRLTGINIPGQGQITNIYDSAHWNSPTKRMLPGGSSTDYTYDPLMRLKKITAKDPGQNPLVTRHYQYSPAGNITSKNTEHGNYTYQYDKLYRLTNAANPTLPDEGYTYDSHGNRLTAEDVSGTWTYNTNNELTGYDTVSFNYDNNGNTTQKTINGVTTKYNYDTEDRLIEVRDQADAITAKYYYDPFGRRLWKEIGGVKTYFLYSDEGLIGEYDSTGTEIKTYSWAPDSIWGTNPLFLKIAGVYYWYQNDHLGTPQKITGTNGSVAWAAIYDSFGNCQVNVEDITNNLRFPGMYFDVETGLYYNLNRYYDPSIGRYLSADPQVDGLNLYAYVLNNPNNLIDPLGLCAVNTTKIIASNIKSALIEGTKGGWYSIKRATHDLGTIGLGATRKVWEGGKWVWRHGYVDIGASFSTTGTLGPGVNIGVQISYSGLYWYYGVGLGIGAGASATLNIGTPPSPGVSVITTVRGGAGWGGQARGGVNLDGQPVGGFGGGTGILGGITVTATRTHRILSW